MANGLYRLDVRLTVQTDDDAIIYVSYNGVSQCDPKRRLLRVGDCYFVTAPTFETQSERYAWLNGIQAIGKMIELKRGDDAGARSGPQLVEREQIAHVPIIDPL